MRKRGKGSYLVVDRTLLIASSAQLSSIAEPPAPPTPIAPITSFPTLTGTPPPMSKRLLIVFRLLDSGLLRAFSAKMREGVLVESAVNAFLIAASVLCGPTLSSRCNESRWPPRSMTAATADLPCAWHADIVASTSELAKLSDILVCCNAVGCAANSCVDVIKSRLQIGLVTSKRILFILYSDG